MRDVLVDQRNHFSFGSTVGVSDWSMGGAVHHGCKSATSHRGRMPILRSALHRKVIEESLTPMVASGVGR